MPSAKQFLGNRCMSNKKWVSKLNPGHKCKITKVEEKENQYGGDPVLGMEVKEISGALRLNATNLIELGKAWGDDTDEWVGKIVIVTWRNRDVKGSEQCEITLTPGR